MCVCVCVCVCAGFTGIDSVYEPPVDPDLVLKAGELTLDECVETVVALLKDHVSCYGFLLLSGCVYRVI